MMDESVEPLSLDSSHNGEGSSATSAPPNHHQLGQEKLEYLPAEEKSGLDPTVTDRFYHRSRAPTARADMPPRLVPSPDPPGAGPSGSSAAGPEDNPSLWATVRLSAEERAFMTASDPHPHAPPPIPRWSFDKWSQPDSWFVFPAEIRNMIYDLLLRFPDAAGLYTAYNRRIDAYYRARRLASAPAPAAAAPDQAGAGAGFPAFDGRLTTPTVLLLSRRVLKECRPALRARVFVLDRIPPWLPGALRPMAPTRFVSRPTLQAGLRRFDLRLSFGEGGLGSGWAWLPVAADVVAVLQERNCFVALRVLVRLHNMKSFNVWREEAEAYYDFMKMVRFFAASLSFFSPCAGSRSLLAYPTSEITP